MDSSLPEAATAQRTATEGGGGQENTRPRCSRFGKFPNSRYPGLGSPYGPAIGDVSASAVPEPAAILLMGTLLLGLAGALKRKWA